MNFQDKDDLKKVKLATTKNKAHKNALYYDR